MARVNTVFSFKTPVTLTLAVLLAHLAILRTPLMRPVLQQNEAPRAFSTRTIELIAPRLTPAPQARVRRAALPHRSLPAPASADRSDSPQIAELKPASSDAVAPPPTMVETPEAESKRPEAATLQDAISSNDDQLAPAPRALREYAVLTDAERLPRSVRITYQVQSNKFPYSLNGELLWQHDDASYNARLVFNAFGQARVQTSRGQITPQGLAPIRFSDKYRSEVAAHFNREQGKVTFSANTPDVPLLAGAQDRLSILVQLAALVGSAPNRYAPATTITIQTIGPRAADTWLFTVGETETLNLPGGEQATLKLVRNPREEFDQKVELWLAPALGYLPARVRITEPNGDFVDQKWLSTQTLDDALGWRLAPQREHPLEIAHYAAKCTTARFKG